MSSALSFGRPARGRVERTFLLPLVLLGMCSVTGCTSRPQHVILITIDSLRADHVRPELTPSLQKLAKDAITFRNAITNATTTLPSHASMLSGLLPFRHGVTGNAGRVGSGTKTLPELLRKRGFATAAVVSSFPLRGEASGLNRGFALYHEDFNSNEQNRKGQLVKTPEETTRVALEWAREHRSESFFLWIHYFPPHGPYTVPPEFIDPAEKPSGELLPISAVNYEPGAIPSYQRLEIPPDAGLYRSRYAGQVRHVDAEVGRLLSTLQQMGVYHDATIIVTSDHGESLGEHGHYFCHGDLVYDEQARIPMLVKLSGGARGGSLAEAPVEAVDVTPTVLQTVRADIPEGLDGRSLIADLPKTRSRFTASTSSEVVSVREGGYMLAVRIGPPQLLPSNHPFRELFFQDLDPTGLNNRVDAEPALAQRLERAIRQRLSALPDTPAMSQEVEDRLKSLGYVR